MKFSPGPGLGGHCIPIDPYYLSWKLKTLDYDARFIKLAGEINTQMPKHVTDLINVSLNRNQKAINGSNILIIGVAYKKDINDYRESPALDIIQLLKEAGANVSFYDPYVTKVDFGGLMMKSIKNLTKPKIKKFDISVIVTDHSNINYKLIESNSNLVVDTRNVFKDSSSVLINRLGQG